MAATKQFLLNYDSNILLPYTTLDCILGKEDDASTATGIGVITDKLLENIKEFAYNKDSGLSSNQIKGDDIKTAYVLGISTLKKDSSTQVYTKFHALSLDSPKHSGQYLGADGTNHDIKFSAESKAKNGWYSTSITVEPSGILDDPIKADVSININISDDCFDTSGGQLYSKYSTKSTSSKVANLAKCTLNRIVKADSSWDPSTGIYEELESFGQNIPVQLNNGVLAACDASVGNIHRPIFYDASAGFKPCSGTFGSNTKFAYIYNGEFAQSTADLGDDNIKPVYLKKGEFAEFTRSVPTYTGIGVGDSSTPIYIDSSGHVQACTYKAGDINSKTLIYASGGQISVQTDSNAGGSTQPVYLKNGEIKPIDSSIGNKTTPIYLENGEIKASSAKVGDKNQPICMLDGTITAFDKTIGSSLNPVYLDEGVIKECKLEPTSISNASKPNLYLMSGEDGKGFWGSGNTTTAGSFDNNDGSVYYLVGINLADASTDGSFTHLTGAKKTDGTGIYFKNYELFQTSDENLKTFTDEIDINFDNLATIKKGIYHWTDDPNKISDIGIGARSLEALYPEIVDENDGVKTIAYNRLGVIALAAIDKLHLRVKELETEMKELKAEIRALKQGK